MGGDDDANFIRHFEAIAPQPMLFGNKDLDQLMEALFLFIIEILVIRKVFLHVALPLAGKRSGQYLFSPIIPKPMPHENYPFLSAAPATFLKDFGRSLLFI